MGMELIFEVRDAEEGGYCARVLGHGIFTEAETWEELRANALAAISVHFEDGPVHPRLQGANPSLPRVFYGHGANLRSPRRGGRWLLRSGAGPRHLHRSRDMGRTSVKMP